MVLVEFYCERVPQRSTFWWELIGGCRWTVQDVVVFQVPKDVWQLFCDCIGERELIGEASGICGSDVVEFRSNGIVWTQHVVRWV